MFSYDQESLFSRRSHNGIMPVSHNGIMQTGFCRQQWVPLDIDKSLRKWEKTSIIGNLTTELCRLAHLIVRQRSVFCVDGGKLKQVDAFMSGKD